MIFFLLVIATALITHFKRKDLIKARKTSITQNYNANPILVKQFQILIIVVCSLMAYIPWIFQVYKKSNVTLYILANVQAQIITGLISPFLFYVFNEKLRKYCIDQLWNFAPDWFYNLRPSHFEYNIENRVNLEMIETSISVNTSSKLPFGSPKQRSLSISSLSNIKLYMLSQSSRRSSF